jgi:ATP-dependent RNA helicase DeaD
MALIKPEETRKLRQIKSETKIDIVEKKIPTGNDIIKAQVGGVFEKLFTEHDNFFEFDSNLIPDLSNFTKEELVHQLLQFQLKDLALYYKDRNDLQEMRLSNERDIPGSRRERGRDRDRDRGGRDRDKDRDRKGGGKRRNNENMTRFFFNLGKRDQLKKMDMLEIINKATSKSKKRADIGDIEILEKFSFFEVDKSFKEEVLKGIASQKFKGKDMRAEVAN